MRYVFSFLLLFSISSAFAQNENDVQHRLDYANKIYFENPDTSYFLCNDLLNQLDQLPPAQQINVLNCLGRYEVLKTFFTSASDHLNQAIKIAKEHDLKTLLARAYHLKGILQGRLGNEYEEIELLEKAYTITEAIKDSSGMRYELSVIFVAYSELNDTSGMRKTIEKLHQFKNQNKGTARYYYFQNQGVYQMALNNYVKANSFFKKALMIAMMENIVDAKPTILKFLGEVHGKMKLYQKGLDFIDNAVSIAKENNLTHEWIEALEVGMILARDNKQFKKAFQFNQTYDSLKEKVYNLERINNINFTEKKLKLAEKDQQLAKNKIELKNEELKTQEANNRFRVTLYSAAALIILFILTIFFVVKLRKLNTKVATQRDAIEEQNKIIQSTLDQMNQSLRYSERLQQSLLPSADKVNKGLLQHFIYFQPKDIVSGDFYWSEQVGQFNFFAVADCTGHGVPGAMVSMVCINALSTAVKNKKLTNPAEILECCSIQIKETFNSSDQFSIMDGMDISLVSFENQSKGDSQLIQWAGANNPLWVKREASQTLEVDQKTTDPAIKQNDFAIYEVKPVKRPVGNSLVKIPFTSHEIKIMKGDTLYLFSDGYADQFGSSKELPTKPGGKKFKYKRLKELLLQTSDLTQQREKLHLTITDWKGDFEQIDDICIAGIKVI